MKKLLLMCVAVVGLSGCVVHPVARHHGYYGDHDGDRRAYRYDRDRDGDGVPNRYDRRPHNPRWY